MFFRVLRAKISQKFFLNLVATIILVGTMQLYVYPNIAKICSQEEYGFFLTVIGIVYMTKGMFGNALNNVRLIMNEEYHNAGIEGDYNFLLLIVLLIVGIGTLIFTFFWGNSYSFYWRIGIVLLLLLGIMREYYVVGFLLDLSYNKVLVLNALLAGAYIVVTFWYGNYSYSCSSWIMILLVGELVALLYLLTNSSLWKEPYSRTELFKKNFFNYTNLIYGSMIGNLLMYFDRNFLYPLLGGEAVAVYFASTVLGKATSMLFGPMNGVLLSFFGQVNFRMTRRKFYIMVATALLIAGIGYVVCIFAHRFVVAYLYPTIYSDTQRYFMVASLAPTITAVCTIISPAVLRYVPLQRLSVFNTVFLLLTIGVSYCGIQQYGLYGFCWAAVFLSFVKMIVYLVLGDYAVRRMEEQIWSKE